MLSSLSIQNIVLIDQLHLTFAEGLCALTGETGAGKSILLDSLALALGQRSEARLIRAGQDKAQVIASFYIPPADPKFMHPAHMLLAQNDLAPAQDGVVILRRTLSVNGPSRAYVNDQPVSVQFLQQLGECLLEIHGQQDTGMLMDNAAHLMLLDEYARVDRTGLQAAWLALHQAREAYAQLEAEALAARREEIYLQEALADIQRLGPQIGEEKKLADLREKLMARESVLAALGSAHQALEAEPDPVRTSMGLLAKISAKMGQEGAEILAALERAAMEIREAQGLMESLSADLQEAEYNLTEIDDRLFALRGQARKHHCAVEDLPALEVELQRKLSLIAHADESLIAAKRAEERAREAFEALAQAAHTTRVTAAEKLDQAVTRELVPLKMERARFVTQLDWISEENQWNKTGATRGSFLVSTNPGAAPGPLKKIASGGEMSRFMLALKVVLAEAGGSASLIFDEVDAGIGGAVADAVGERLARLGASRQVLVVTHSPQVAARADHHWIVRKDGKEDVKTYVEELTTRTSRAEEIARMLSGAAVTPEARAAADALLGAAA